MKFFFYTDVFFEEWDWRNTETGIGGSETHQIEMAWRLARRGHEVICYAPVPPESNGALWHGVQWRRFDNADFDQDGIWIIYRNPEVIDQFSPSTDRQIWFMAQDEWYSGFTSSRIEKITRFIALCQTHANACISRCPELKQKVVISSNGIKMDMIRDLESGSTPIRNPKRLMYASSPDRGLAFLLKIFRRAREIVPDLELHAFYGFDNIDKLIAMDSAKFSHYRRLKDQLILLMDQPQVFWHGRISQTELMSEWMKTGIWCYPTNFTETSCITCMEAQALGAIPLTNPIWALSENVKTGWFLEGDTGDPLVQARYAAQISHLATHPELQNDIRSEMMIQARFLFNWERVVDQWEAWHYGFSDRVFIAQYNFQLKHAKGKILNVGSDIDAPEFGSRGAINLDFRRISPIMNVPTRINVQADARALPFNQTFDTVILGDILEHFNDEGAVALLKQAKTASAPNGRILLTLPNDWRSTKAQHGVIIDDYGEGISAYHTPVSINRLKHWLSAADLNLDLYQSIDYTFADGHGVICS